MVNKHSNIEKSLLYLLKDGQNRFLKKSISMKMYTKIYILYIVVKFRG